MHKRSGSRYVSAVVLLLLAFAIVATAADEDLQRLKANDYTSLVLVVTALSGQQIADLAKGNVIGLDSLSAESRAQLMNAAELGAGKGPFQERLATIPEGVHLGLKMKVDYCVVFSGPAFPAPDEVSLLETCPGLDLRNQKDSGWTDAVSSIADPPSSASILGGAPAQLDAKADYLRQSMHAVAQPLGDLRLKLVCQPALSYPEMAQVRQYRIDSLTAEQAAWMKSLYLAHKLKIDLFKPRVDQLRKEHPDVGDTPTTLVVKMDDGNMSVDLSKFPKYQLPEWNSMASSSVQFKITYTAVIKDISGNVLVGYGWSVN